MSQQAKTINFHNEETPNWSSQASIKTKTDPDHPDLTKNSIERNGRINKMLQDTHELCKMYIFGGSRCHSNNCLDKLVNERRPSMLFSFMYNKPFPFGPLSNTLAIQRQVSDGEESEIDITDIATLPILPATLKEESLNQNTIQTTAMIEFKGGPRVSDVVDLMVDLESLKEIKNFKEIQNFEKTSQLQVYLTL